MDVLTAFSRLTDNINQNQDELQLNVEDIMNSELGNFIDYGLWKETMELQKKFNDQVAPGWMQDKRNQKYNFWMAILDETTEVLNSKHWKWWKDPSKMNEVDWDNVQVELIDLFHFILSICIQQNAEHVLFSQLLNLQMNKDKITLIKDDKYFEDFWNNFLMAVQMKNLPVMAVSWGDFWFRAGGDVNVLFKEYRIKAALNKIRQEFGYGKEYQKMWNFNGKMVEDNVVAWELSKDIPLDKNTLENVTKVLREFYLAQTI